MLKKEGDQAKGMAANSRYRQEVKDWQLTPPPDISHRYMAVRSGVGSFGWSGNVGIKDFGTAIILGTAVTDAELTPTDPIPEDETFCDNCKRCFSACAVEMLDKKKGMSVAIGGATFTHAARREYLLCDFCCGGFTVMFKSGKWSTWSPGRFTVPEEKSDLYDEFFRAVDLYKQRPPMPGGFPHPALDNYRQYLTCGNCQIMCWGNRDDTRENLKILKNSGCVLQKSNGELYALPPKEAEAAFEAMEPSLKALYS